MLKLVMGGDVFTPQYLGKADILFADRCILKIGEIDGKALARAKVEVETISAKGKWILPGFIDPHAHFLGGSGEDGGFSSQTPEIELTEFTLAGVTTVVGTLGADTTMKTMPGLIAKAKGYKERGLNAWIWTGGYSVPPATVMGTVREDVMFIEEVIGVGEIAIADLRSSEPTPMELAKVVHESYLAGMLTGKSQLSHFHVGETPKLMSCLERLIEYDPDVKPEWLYPTHVNRSAQLIQKAISFARRGSFVDMDTVDRDLPKWLRVYVDSAGPLDKLTISSDAAKTKPGHVLIGLRECLKQGFDFGLLLPLVTKNPARAMKFKGVGELKEGYEASMGVYEPNTLELHALFSKGHCMVKHGKAQVEDRYREDTTRDMAPPRAVDEKL